MTKQEARFVKLCVYMASLFGVLIWFTKTFLKVEGDFGIVQHASLDYWRAFHLLSVPFILIAFGIIYKLHLLPAFKGHKKQRKRSGYTFVFFAIFSIFSGQSLFIISNQTVLDYARLFHLGIGLGVVGVFFLHSKKKHIS